MQVFVDEGVTGSALFSIDRKKEDVYINFCTITLVHIVLTPNN